MKIFIEVEVPGIKRALLNAKGDRSLRSVARDTGITHFNISRILSGKQGTTIETLRLLGDALGVNVDNYVRDALKGVGL